MGSTSQAGLGRGLAALIPSAQQLERRHLSPTERLLDQLVSAGFDLLAEQADLALCAYLHAPHAGDPHLFLRAPAFESLTPTSAFRLFHQIAMLTNLDDDEGEYPWEGRTAHFLRTHGRRSDGLHVVAPMAGAFEPAARRVVREVCRAFGAVAHQVHAGDDDDLPTPHLVLTTGTEGVAVEATVHDVDTTRIGRGRAERRPDAVARAVLDAMAPTLQLVDVRVLASDPVQAVLVVLTDDEDRLRLGVATVETEDTDATALATLRAVLRSG